MNQGVLAPPTLHIPAGSLLDPYPPHAAAAGNGKRRSASSTWSFGALAPGPPGPDPGREPGNDEQRHLWRGPWQIRGGCVAARPYAYYETIGGGAGRAAQRWRVGRPRP